MEAVVRKTLLEILDLMHSQLNSPHCGYDWCEAARGLKAPAMREVCDHVSTCWRNCQLEERIHELKREVMQGLPSDAQERVPV